MGFVVYRLQAMVPKTFWTLCSPNSHDSLEFYNALNLVTGFGDVMRGIIEIEDVIEKKCQGNGKYCLPSFTKGISYQLFLFLAA